MSVEVKKASYTKQVSYPLPTEQVTINSAACKKCDDIIKSLKESLFVKCKCNNVAIRGGTKYILHQWLDKSFYENRSIILLNGD